MVSRTNIQLGEELKNRLSALRKKAANPSIMDIAHAIGVSSSTVRTALSGYSVKWTTYIALLGYLKATEDEVKEFRNAWIQSKNAVFPDSAGPIWGKQLHEKIDYLTLMVEELQRKLDAK